jgi:16S rRNA (adenine1518-N6/adenine1519-N6)-dimethyltransferase
VVKALFAARRKTVRNGLKAIVDEAEVHLRAAGIDPGERAEKLDLEAFGRLALRVAPLLTPAAEPVSDEDDDAGAA